MEDNYFDKKIKDILESGSEFPVDPTAEKDMLQRLRGAKASRRRPFPWLWLAAAGLLLPILWGGKVFFNHYQQLQTQLTALQTTVEQLADQSRVDTIVQRQLIQQYDTIYKVSYITKYITEKAPTESINNQLTQTSYIPRLFSLSGRDNRLFNYSLMNTYRSSGLLPPYLLTDRSDSGYFYSIPPDYRSPADFEVFDAWSSVVPELEGLPYTLLDDGSPRRFQSLFDLPEDPPEFKYGQVDPSYYFTPQGLRLSLHTSPQIYPNHPYGGSGSGYGFAAEIPFPGNRSLTIGVEQLSLNFEVKDDPAGFADFPMITPNDPTDNLHELKGNFDYLQIPITFRQYLRNDKKLQPSISLGMVAYRPIKQDFTYEFINASGEYTLSNSFENGTFIYDNIRFGGGLTYWITKAISVDASFTYQHAFSKDEQEYFNLRYGALQVGVKYQLF